MLTDAHIHLDFIAQREHVVRDAARCNLRFFANTCTPTDWLMVQNAPWTHTSSVRLGIGAHPWWVADGRIGGDELELIERHILEADAHETLFVGEIGLDFLDKHTAADSHARQCEAFSRIARACAARRTCMSVHSVASARTCVDILQESACVGSICTSSDMPWPQVIFHWYSGSTEDLWRAIKLGCFFSINPMKTQTKRAKEQLKLIPPQQLLFETDLPTRKEGNPSAATIRDNLLLAAYNMAAIRQNMPKEIRASVDFLEKDLPSPDLGNTNAYGVTRGDPQEAAVMREMEFLLEQAQTNAELLFS
ncbi:MAG: TatD family hydrolase [Atopobiaceae bacterium]